MKKKSRDFRAKMRTIRHLLKIDPQDNYEIFLSSMLNMENYYMIDNLGEVHYLTYDEAQKLINKSQGT